MGNSFINELTRNRTLGIVLGSYKTIIQALDTKSFIAFQRGHFFSIWKNKNFENCD